MVSKLDICNSALVRCGSESIASLTDESKRAKTVTSQFNITLGELLADSPWNFAIKRATLEQTSTNEQSGNPYIYSIPSDCIRVLELENGTPYRIEGSSLLADVATTIKIKYISNIEDTTKYSPSFVKALVLKLAEDISYQLVQSATLQQ